MLNKNEFLQTLKNNMAEFPYGEVEKTLSFYEECIDDRIEDGMTEEEAVEALGDINNIVKEIKVNLPLATLISKKVKNSKEKAGNKTVWMVIAICSSPFWVPLAIAFAAVIFAVYVSLWAVIISLFAALFSLAIGSVGAIIFAFIKMFTLGLVDGGMFLGTALCLMGIFIMLIKPMCLLCKKIVLLTKLFINKIKELFIGRKIES